MHAISCGDFLMLPASSSVYKLLLLTLGQWLGQELWGIHRDKAIFCPVEVIYAGEINLLATSFGCVLLTLVYQEHNISTCILKVQGSLE